jgi:hypothetical protein
MPLRLLSLLLAASLVYAADAPRLSFTKRFPGSVPEYVSFWIDNSGRGEYKEAPDDDQPLPIQLTARETSVLFELAGKVGNFSRPLDSGLKVAFTGDKTFRYEDGAASNEVKFNYTTNVDAQALLDWFEKIGETCRHAINLDRTARYDRLGLDRAVLELQRSFENNRIVGSQQLLPALDRIAKNKSTFNRVRELAAQMAEAIRAGAAPAP